MGCVSAKDVQQSITKNIFNNFKKTNIIAFDQLFLLEQQCLKELDVLQNNVISRRINLINITKANLLNNPKLIEAFKLWTWGVSLCNRGNSKAQNVQYIFNNSMDSLDHSLLFSYNLGLCSELRFHWFGIILKEYIDQIQKARSQFPLLQMKSKDIYDKLKTMREQSNIYFNSLSLEEKNEAYLNMEFNMNKIQKSMFNSDQFYSKLKELEKELDILIEKSIQYENEADLWGRKLYRDLDVISVGNDTFRMRAKMNSLVLLYHPGQKRSQEEEQYYYNIKLERSKIKPKILNDEINKIFYFKQRWTGCDVVDSKWSEISFILEQHDEQYKIIKEIRNKIRNSLMTYKYVEDNLIVAWKIYCLSLITELKNVKIIININEQNEEILNLHNMSQNLNDQTKLFNQYFCIIKPTKFKYLKEYWKKLDFDKNWIQGSFMKLEQFSQLPHQHQYNMMTNQAKNIYEFTSQINLYQALYEKKYSKLEKEAFELWTKSKMIFEEMDKLYQQYQIDKDVDKLMKQQLRSDDIILKKKSKLSKFN